MADGESTKKGLSGGQSQPGQLDTSAVRRSVEPRGSQIVLPELGAVIAEKYRVEQLIAQGGMGAVYAATHVISGKRVALKWMLPALGMVPGATERFVREARATARIDHPNVVDIYDVGSDQGSVYLVMEFLRGETLHERMTRSPLSPRSAIALLMPALRGVAAAHAQGVIHRDLKPDNIFLCQGADGEVREPKVLDFGISKIASADELRDNALTHSGVVMGTPYYMSPEQARGANQVDARSDVYAFGVILYELLTRRRPFEAETYNQLIFKIATEDATPIKQLNPYVDKALIAIVERAMARDPVVRFQSVEALGAALEPFASGVAFRPSSSIPGELSADPELSLPPAPPVVAQRAIPSRAPAGRRPLVLLGVAALGLVIAGMLLWRLYAGPPVADRRLAPDEHEVRPLAPASEPQTTQVVAARPGSSPPGPVPNAEPIAQPAAPEATHPPSAASPLRKPRAESVRGEREGQNAPAKTGRAPAAPGAGLPSDWDERMRATPNAPGSPPSAGKLSESDLK